MAKCLRLMDTTERSSDGDGPNTAVLTPRAIAQLAVKSSTTYGAVALLERWLASTAPQPPTQSAAGAARRGPKTPKPAAPSEKSIEIVKQLRTLCVFVGIGIDSQQRRLCVRWWIGCGVG